MIRSDERFVSDVIEFINILFFLIDKIIRFYFTFLLLLFYSSNLQHFHASCKFVFCTKYTQVICLLKIKLWQSSKLLSGPYFECGDWS